MASFKNKSTHGGKGKALRHPVSEAKPEYNQRSSGSSGSGSPSSKFLGGTKGNRDLNPNRTAGAPAQGGYKGK